MGVKKIMFFNILLVIIYMIFTVSGLICYKYGTNTKFELSFDNLNLGLQINLVAIIGLIFYLISFILYLIVLPKFNLTDILPIISAITSIAIFILSVFFLKEEVNIQKIIGTILIIIGVFVITFKLK